MKTQHKGIEPRKGDVNEANVQEDSNTRKRVNLRQVGDHDEQQTEETATSSPPLERHKGYATYQRKCNPCC